MRIRLLAIALLLVGGALTVDAQHGGATHEAPAPAGPAEAAKSAAAPKPAAPAAHGAEKAPAPAPHGAVEKPAASGTHGTTAAAPRPPVAVKPGTKRTDMKAMVERIQQRIDEELGPAAPAKPAGKTTARSASPAPAPRRVKLVWRVSLEWPSEPAVVWPGELTEQR